MENPFYLEVYWEKFSELSRLENASELQKGEMKKAFYAGLSQMFFVMSEKLPELEDEEVIVFGTLEFMRQQLLGYWDSLKTQKLTEDETGTNPRAN